jgi:protein kinase-like protein
MPALVVQSVRSPLPRGVSPPRNGYPETGRHRTGIIGETLDGIITDWNRLAAVPAELQGSAGAKRNKWLTRGFVTVPQYGAACRQSHRAQWVPAGTAFQDPEGRLAEMKAGKSTVVPPLAVPWARQPQVGEIVGGRYRLEEWLERGAMGSVWRAEQVRLRSPAAIKFLEPSLIEVPEMLERFLQEARSAAAVQSAHVIQVFDYGSEGGLPYIVMEFLKGENLAARLAHHGTLSPAELDKIFGEIARGLGQAHALGVIHRDVKPANIFLVRQGMHEIVKLIDFGIAKVKADALQVSQVVGTQVGTVLGTPQYMSPEQMRGRGTLDHRTDLWALAIIACECLTGRYPFSGTSIGDLSVQICAEQPLAPSTLGDVPAGFDEWFFKGTSKEPSGRFESAGEMADALTKVLALGKPAQASVPRTPLLVLGSTSAEPLRTKVRRVTRSLRLPAAWRVGARTGKVGWALLGLALLGLALLVVAGGPALLRAQRRPPPQPSQPMHLPTSFPRRCGRCFPSRQGVPFSRCPSRQRPMHRRAARHQCSPPTACLSYL